MQSVKTPLQLDAVLGAVRSVLPDAKREYALHEPKFNGNEWKYVKECLDTGWVSTAGPFIRRFEEHLEKSTGVKHAVAMVNGTAALHMALLSVGAAEETEVLVQDLTFVATANAVAYCGAAAHFVDNDEVTLGMDAVKLREYLKKIAEVRHDSCWNRSTKRRIVAAVAMHTFGHPADLDALKAVCRDFQIVLIEDAAEAMGSLYKGTHVGRWGRAAVLSFNGNKILTTGGGGALLTEDDELAAQARHISTTAKRPHAWEFVHDRMGYNYRMPNLNAALGLAQLECLPGFLKAKRALAGRYEAAFRNVEGLQFVSEPPNTKSNYWLNAIKLGPESAPARDQLLALLHAQKIKARPVWTLMHKLPKFRECERADVSTAESLEARLVNLPSSAFL